MTDMTASDGRRIAFSDTGGDGPAILCLAGLTRDRRDFEALAEHLSPDYRVVSMDYRGRGDSEWAKDPLTEYHPAIEGRDAVELLVHLGIPSATIIGTSRGGMIGMGLAAQAPQLVKALILNDIGPVIEAYGLERIMGYLGRPLPYRTFEAAVAGLKVAFEGGMPTLTDEEWVAYAQRTFHEENEHPILSYDAKLREAVEAAMESSPADFWPIFEAVTCPVLVLRGANSDLLADSTVAEMKARKPGTESALIPDRGHCPFLDEPEALDAIDNFLARNA
ncbi:alpha/beta hydrolase [Rhodobacteraceae bacterium NNCM2]|nr:alpha/beta hydrolase [Coraliihabitans acroporae]